MAKRQLKKNNARMLYMDGKYNQKEIAAIVGVTESTLSNWAKEGKWKATRTAALMSDQNIEENEKLALANLGEMMLEKQRERKELAALPDGQRDMGAIAQVDKEIIGIADAMSKASAKYLKMNKNNAINYAVYVNVMNSVFDALREYDPKLHMKTIDFQLVHSQEMAVKMG